jgi:hypothetical protein
VLANLPTCLSVSQISSESSGIAHQIRRNPIHKHKDTNTQKTCATRMNSSQKQSENKTKLNFQMKTESTTCTFLGSSEICLSLQLGVPLQLPLYPGLARPRAPILNYEDLPSSARELPLVRESTHADEASGNFLLQTSKNNSCFQPQ